MQDDYRRERLGPLISSPEASKLPKATILWPSMYPTLLRYFREAVLGIFIEPQPDIVVKVSTIGICQD